MTTKFRHFRIMGLHMHLQGVGIWIIFLALITIVISLFEVFTLDMIPKFLGVVVSLVAQFAFKILSRKSFQNVLKSSFLVCLAHIRYANFLAQLHHLEMPINKILFELESCRIHCWHWGLTGSRSRRLIGFWMSLTFLDKKTNVLISISSLRIFSREIPSLLQKGQFVSIICWVILRELEWTQNLHLFAAQTFKRLHCFLRSRARGDCFLACKEWEWKRYSHPSSHRWLLFSHLWHLYLHWNNFIRTQSYENG